MKKKTLCILVAAMAFAGIQSAQAGDKEKYLVGGLLGGWILNEVFDTSVHTHVRHVPSVRVERNIYHHRSQPSGRYECRQVRVWVPGYYERVRTRCGRVETRWVSGRYEYRTEKVWVPYGSCHSQSHYSSRHRWY